jgi:hypothetical protein
MESGRKRGVYTLIFNRMLNKAATQTIENLQLHLKQVTKETAENYIRRGRHSTIRDRIQFQRGIETFALNLTCYR